MQTRPKLHLSTRFLKLNSLNFKNKIVRTKMAKICHKFTLIKISILKNKALAHTTLTK